jgi:hypothetical protein
MAKVISIHYYELKSSISSEMFELAFKNARQKCLFKLPGLSRFHFLKGIRGHRKGKYAAIWIYESAEDWIKLWGSPDRPNPKQAYPYNWKIWEDEILSPLLEGDPDKIDFTSYEEI